MTDFLSLRVGNQWYGVDVETVIEVLHLVALDELPLAPPDILGLMTLRNQVLPVVDLRVRFHTSNKSLTLQTPIVAMDTPEGAIGLVVDDVDTVVTINQESQYDGQGSEHVSGGFRIGDRLLLLLDTAHLRLHVDQHTEIVEIEDEVPEQA